VFNLLKAALNIITIPYQLEIFVLYLFVQLTYTHSHQLGGTREPTHSGCMAKRQRSLPIDRLCPSYYVTDIKTC
jgi:hypothetical protein